MGPASWDGPPREEFALRVRDELLPLRQADFSTSYKAVLAYRLREVDFTKRVDPIVANFNDYRGGSMSSAPEVWKAARNRNMLPKTGDLLRRFLHEKVATGKKLHWLNEDRQRCPIDGEDQTITHVWWWTLYSIAIWALWRSYLKVNFEEDKNALHPSGVAEFYRGWRSSTGNWY